MQLAHTLEEHWLYLSEGLRHPFATAAVFPTNWRVINKLAAMTPMGTKRVLEIGPGSGRLIRKLLATGRIDETGTIGAIELNARFYNFLLKTMHDSRVSLVEGSAEDVLGHRDTIFGKGKKINRVYASIPFSLMEKTRLDLFEAVREILADDGEFIIYILRNVKRQLDEVFDDVEVTEVNGQLIPPVPYIIHRAQKFAPILPVGVNGFKRNDMINTRWGVRRHGG